MFTVVELGVDMTDIKRIRLERSPLQVFLHYVYSLLRPFIRCDGCNHGPDHTGDHFLTQVPKAAHEWVRIVR